MSVDSTSNCLIVQFVQSVELYKAGPGAANVEAELPLRALPSLRSGKEALLPRLLPVGNRARLGICKLGRVRAEWVEPLSTHRDGVDPPAPKKQVSNLTGKTSFLQITLKCRCSRKK